MGIVRGAKDRQEWNPVRFLFPALTDFAGAN